MKIFVSICSYRDPLLHHTLKSLIENQWERNEITYGIFEQTILEDSLESKYPELVKLPNVRYKRIDPQHSDGVCWARHVNSLQVTDEQFYYQVDSHMVFDKHWDRHLVNDYRKAMKKYNNEKVIITASCKTFNLDGNGVPNKHVLDKHTSKAGYFIFQKNYILGAHGEYRPSNGDVSPGIHIFAGNFFTRTQWLKEVGINPRIFFEGEEQVMVLTSFAAGYQICHPTEIHCYHYTDTHNYITKQQVEQVVSFEQLSRNQEKSRNELKSVLDSIEDEVFEEYRKYSGVDYINRKLESRCIARTITLPADVVNDWEIPDRND